MYTSPFFYIIYTLHSTSRKKRVANRLRVEKIIFHLQQSLYRWKIILISLIYNNLFSSKSRGGPTGSNYKNCYKFALTMLAENNYISYTGVVYLI